MSRPEPPCSVRGLGRMKRLLLPLLLLACQRDPWNDMLVYCDPATPAYDQLNSVFISADERNVSTNLGPCTSKSTRLIAVDGGYDLEDELLDVRHIELDERPEEARVIISYRQLGVQRVHSLECMSLPRQTMFTRLGKRLRSALANDELHE